MHHTKYYVAGILLTAALAVPAAIRAVPAPQEARVQVRVYDKQHKDYHNWDDNENRAWGQYQSEHKKNPHEFTKSNKREQGDYWNWRHAHPDKDR
jgi:hypothetical protein